LNFSAGNTNTLANILGDDELRRMMGQRAQKIADTELSWNTIAEKTSEFYRS
jgi:glycosyltransferase involved in cell wall biosynthesis